MTKNIIIILLVAYIGFNHWLLSGYVEQNTKLHQLTYLLLKNCKLEAPKREK